MHKIGFELEVDEGCITPSTTEVTLAIRQALPKEFWADYREDTWGIATVFPLDSDGRPIGIGLMERPQPTRKMLEAQLAEQKKLVGHLDRDLRVDEERIANLERCNGNQSDTINTMMNERKNLELRLTDALLEWEQAKTDRDTARRIVTMKGGIIKGYQKLCRQKNARIKELRHKWGDDQALAELEDIKDAIDGTVLDLGVKLDEIRTQR